MVTHFGGGLVTEVAYNNPRSREMTAQHCLDCRSDAQGWLVPRKGYISAEFPDTPEYERLSLPKVDKDAIDVVEHMPTAGETYGLFNTTEFVFQAIKVDETETQEDLPEEQGTTGEYFPALAPKVVVGEMSDPVRIPSVRMEDAFNSGTGPGAGNDTSLISLAVRPQSSTQEISIEYKLTANINLTVQIQDHRGLPLRTILLDETYVFGGSNDQKPNQDDPTQKQLLWDGRDAAGNLLPPRPRGSYVVAFIERQYIANAEDTLHYAFLPLHWEATAMQINLPNVPEANYIDVYAREADSEGLHYWVARVATESRLIYHFPLRVDLDSTPLVFFQPDWHYIAEDDFRRYVAEVGSNELYMSYYEPGTAEKLEHNFADFIPLELDGGVITGLKFLRDNFLVVYATNQIQYIATDPDVNRVSVADFLKPTDEKGETIGCAAPGSIVSILGWHYFLATNRYVYRFNGEQIMQISDPIHGIFQTVPLALDGENLELQDAVAFSFDETYVISVDTADGYRTLVYDLTHKIWWQDSFGIQAVRKTKDERVLAELRSGESVQLYTGDTDNGEPIRRVWKGNPYLRRSHSHWNTVHIYALGAADIDVIATTEQAEASGELNITDPGDWWSQRLGINLRGRFYVVEIATESLHAIDRITINERPQRSE